MRTPKELVRYVVGIFPSLSLLAFACGIGALIWRIVEFREPERSVWDADSILALAGLAALALIAVLFAFWGRVLMTRLRKVGREGVEFQVWSDIARIPDMKDAPIPPDYLLGEERQKLTPMQSWFYELGGSLLFHLRHLGVSAHDLSGKELQNYRELVLWVGQTALSSSETYKALETLQLLESLTDLTKDERVFLGTAYFWTGVHERRSGEARVRERFRRAADLFRKVIVEDDGDATSHFSLAYAYDELGRYDDAIRCNRRAVQLDEDRWGTSARWNEAVSWVKKNRLADALAALSQAPAGKAWGEIYDDPELTPLRIDPTFGEEFLALRDSKLQ